MSQPIQVLIIEDSDDDFELLLNELRRGGYEPVYKRVQTSKEMLDALQGDQAFEIVLSDYKLPFFSGSDALRILRSRDRDTPFIFVSGTIREDIAVGSMHSGANDYVMKDNLQRLIPAIQRELSEATTRRENKKQQIKLDYISKHDHVTSLANRSLFQATLDIAVNYTQEDEMLAVIFLDVDSFSAINISMGQSAGDQLLKAIADRLKSLITHSDQVACFGSDQFAMLFTNIKQIDEIMIIINKVNLAISKPFIIQNKNINITCRAGISLYPMDSKDAQTLMNNASIALSNAKLSGPNSFQFCTANMTIRAKEKVRLENDLREALANNEFSLHYQPIIEIPFMRIKGMEALIRWHKYEKIIPPNDFMPIAEKTHLIIPIGEWVIRTACAQAKIWNDTLNQSIFIAINISPIQLKHTDIVDVLANALKDTGLAANCLKLEVTETSIMDDIHKSIEILHKIKDMGIKISIDDFGTGYSSLNYLKQLPIDYLKIDQSFIQDMLNNKSDDAIVKTIIALAKNLGYSIIAEGIETEEQLTYINQLGCFEVQGYYFSKPMSAEIASNYIKKNNKR